MEQRIKTNRLAIIAFVLALASVLLYGLFLLPFVQRVFPPAPGHYSPLTGPAGPLLLLAAIASVLSLAVALIVGLIATIQIFRRRGAEKGMVFALSGMLISAALGGVYAFQDLPQEKPRARVSVVQGKPQGPLTLFRGGNVIVTGTFEDGRKEGLWTSYVNGIKHREVSYRNGLKEGRFHGWYSSAPPYEYAKGKLHYEGRFSVDRLQGEMTSYHPTGEVQCKFLLDHGEIKEAGCWHPQGAELSQTEATKEARITTISVTTSFELIERDVDGGVRQILRSSSEPSGTQ